MFTIRNTGGGQAAFDERATHMQDGLWHRTEASRRRWVGRTRPYDDCWQPRDASINGTFSKEKKGNGIVESHEKDRRGASERRMWVRALGGANRLTLKKTCVCLLLTVRHGSTSNKILTPWRDTNRGECTYRSLERGALETPGTTEDHKRNKEMSKKTNTGRPRNSKMQPTGR